MNLSRRGSVEGAGPEVVLGCFRMAGTGVNVHGDSCATLQGKKLRHEGRATQLGVLLLLDLARRHLCTHCPLI